MKVKSTIFMMMILMFSGAPATADENNYCQDSQRCDYFPVLVEYSKQLQHSPPEYIKTGSETLPQLAITRYRMTSQSWSPDKLVNPAAWQHDVDIFIPEKPKSQRALLVVNNGINYGDASQQLSRPTDFSESVLANIARATQTIVVSVSNVPNQYLSYQNADKSLKEDDSVARSWALFMQDPAVRKLMPLHIPMAASVSQAMRLAKKELASQGINKFIVTGASKRGWVSWLTAIADPDVEAIIPFAIDLLDIRAGLKHMYRSYGGNWPIAFYPYYQQGIDRLIDTPSFGKLIQIEDPLLYLHSDYRARLHIPKYMINASGDDFYTPDNARFYFDELPGSKTLRVAPNTDHYGIKNFTEQSIIAFVNRLQRQQMPPQVASRLRDNTLSVFFSEKPLKIVRWTATNPTARDFRYACGIRYQSSLPAVKEDKRVDITLHTPATGWEASYIEATFSDGFIATSQVYITPDDHYPQVAPPEAGAACQTLPGRVGH